MFKEYKEYHFVDVIPYPAWYTETMVSNYTCSYDGFNYTKQERQVLVGTYFFLSSDTLLHKREVYTFVEALSEIGGFFSVILVVISFLSKTFTRMKVNHKFIKRFHSNEKGIY